MKKIVFFIISIFFFLFFNSLSPAYASECTSLSKEDCYKYRSCNFDVETETCYLNTLINPKSTFSDNVGNYNVAIGLKSNLTTINGIISTFLPYILSFAGVILLFMLISGGFTMLTAVSNPEVADAGKQRISAALLGFILLFISYWIIQILEIILGINILGS